MKMHARLLYLEREGFEVAAIAGYHDRQGPHNARISYFEKEMDGNTRLRTEHFHVTAEEMERCCHIFFERFIPKS